MEISKITLEQYIGFRKKQAVTDKKAPNYGKIVAFIVLALFSLFWKSRLLMLLALTAFGFCMSAIRIAKYSLIPEVVFHHNHK